MTNKALSQPSSGFTSPLRRQVGLALFCVVAVAASACSGDSTDDSKAEATSTTTAEATSTTTEVVAGTATAEVAGTTYEFTGAKTCEIGAPGTALVSADNNLEGRSANIMFGSFGDDIVGVDVEENTTSFFATLDGETWRGAANPPDVVVTDDGAEVTGEMMSGSVEGPGDGTGRLEAVTVSISCS